MVKSPMSATTSQELADVNRLSLEPGDDGAEHGGGDRAHVGRGAQRDGGGPRGGSEVPAGAEADLRGQGAGVRDAQVRGRG